jgi:hypothetical protein
MNALEAQLSYPFGDALPEPGGSLEVAPGVRWVRMKLPFALDHINLWLLRDELEGDDGTVVQGWTIVDCGVANDATRAAWERVFDLLQVLFKRRLDLHQTTFAMGESIAHLHALWFDGKLVRQLDDAAVYRFESA